VATSRSQAAAEYKPDKTRVLFIAEAPPNDEDRYFYFEDVPRNDWLWIAVMKALFRSEWGRTKEERIRKAWWLRRFQGIGCWLIDAVKEPLSGGHKHRVAVIRASSAAFVSEVRAIAPEQVVLIKSTVYEALFCTLSDEGFAVANDRALPFPASNHQVEFDIEMGRLIDSGRLHVDPTN